MKPTINISQQGQQQQQEEVLSDKQFLFLLDDLAIKKQWEVVEKMCLISIKSHPPEIKPHPVILNMLSRAYFENKKYQESLETLNDILETLGSNSAKESIKFNITKCLYHLRRAPEAIEILESFSEERKKTVEHKVEYSLYQNAIGNPEKSKEILNTVPDKDTYDCIAFNYAWFLFRENKFKEAYKGIVRGANIQVWGNEDELQKRADVTEERKWKFGEKVDTLAFYLEGGLGDEMVFLRYIQFLEPYAKKIKIFCAPKLIDMFKDCGYQNVFTHAQVAEEEWDKYVPSMSSPYILGLDDPKEGIIFPYLSRKASPVKEMDEIAKGKKKICIKWRGNPKFEHDQFREFPLEGLLKLDKFGQLFSIQIEDNYDLKKNDNVWDLTHLINSWNDTYDIINESDLLVTSCSSVAHLAGIMGKKVIVLVPLVPYLTWASDSQPWYPDNVTIVRQKEYGSWDSAFEELYEKVEEILG